MSSMEGYPSTQKDERITAENVTVSPIGPFKAGLDVRIISFSIFAADAVEAGSTPQQLVLTGHVARRGDVVRVTSGAYNTYESSIDSVTTNTVILSETLPGAPSAGDTIEIFRSDVGR